MKKLFLVLACLLLTTLLFGCTQNPEELLKENSELKPFFDAHPDAQLKSITKFTKEEFETEKDYWNENCESVVKSGSYYKAVFADETGTITALAEVGKLKIICLIEESKSPPQEVVEDNNEPVLTQEEEIIEEQCVANWSCTKWNTCSNQEQSRTCTDLNACETTTNKPSETQECVDEIIDPETCVEEWSCSNWSTCNYDRENPPTQTRSCTEANSCDTITSKPTETQNCCYTNCYDWSGTCVDGKERRSCDIVGCSQAEWDAVNYERDCEGPTCTETDNGNDPFTAGITTDIYGMDYPDSCVYGSVSEWYCEGDTKGYENHECEYKCENNACVIPPTECLNGDDFCPSECTYQQDSDCACTTHSDCLTENVNAAAICEESFSEFSCIDSIVTTPAQITGDLTSFCTAYVNDCQLSNIIDLAPGPNGLTDLQLQIYEKPDSFDGCNIKILWGGGYIVDFWADVGNDLETCKHNIPIYYYNSTAEMCGSAPCYGQFP
jgi:hypothetical protein